MTTKKVTRKMFNMANVAYGGELVKKMTKVYGWDVKVFETVVNITVPVEDLGIYYKMF